MSRTNEARIPGDVRQTLNDPANRHLWPTFVTLTANMDWTGDGSNARGRPRRAGWVAADQAWLAREARLNRQTVRAHLRRLTEIGQIALWSEANRSMGHAREYIMLFAASDETKTLIERRAEAREVAAREREARKASRQDERHDLRDSCTGRFTPRNSETPGQTEFVGPTDRRAHDGSTDALTAVESDNNQCELPCVSDPCVTTTTRTVRDAIEAEVVESDGRRPGDGSLVQVPDVEAPVGGFELVRAELVDAPMEMVLNESLDASTAVEVAVRLAEDSDGGGWPPKYRNGTRRMIAARFDAMTADELDALVAGDVGSWAKLAGVKLSPDQCSQIALAKLRSGPTEESSAYDFVLSGGRRRGAPSPPGRTDEGGQFHPVFCGCSECNEFREASA